MAKRGNPNMKKGAKSVNPNGRRGKPKPKTDEAPRGDGYKSTLTGLGSTSYDKRIFTSYAYDHVTRREAVELWTGDDIAARAIDIPVEDAFRQGFEFTAKPKDGAEVDTKALQDQILQAWEDLHVLETGAKALGYEMAYGGSGVLLGFEGLRSEELAQPIQTMSNGVRPLKFLNVLEPEELPVLYHYVNPLEENYGKPAVFTLNPMVAGTSQQGVFPWAGLPIAAENLHIMPGIRVTKAPELSNYNGWGESIYTRLWHVLRDFNNAWGGVGNLVIDFSQTVMKLKNLAQLLAETGGSDKLRTRLEGMDLGRSILRAVVIDSEEDVERKTTNVTGLSEILTQYMARVSSAAGGMPITKLFGVPPSGLNSSGESDINQWDDRIKSIQDKRVIPYLRRITQILIDSGAVEGMDGVESWKITAKPLRQPTEAEVAATRLAVAQADQIYVNMGALSDEDVANSRWGGDAYSMETVVDWEERERLKAEMEKAAQEAALLNPPPMDPDDEATLPQDEDAPGAANAEETEPDDDDEDDDE